MKRKTRKHSAFLTISSIAIVSIAGCGSSSPHSGRIPFRWMEKPPATPVGVEAASMEIVMEHGESEGGLDDVERRLLRPGDVIAFHMSHRDAWNQIRNGAVQKLPYNFFRYGHIAVVVPVSDEAETELRLLQVAMKQAVNADSKLDYLSGKSWFVYRPPGGSVDPGKLAEFTRQVSQNAGDAKKAYDYGGVLGLRNAPFKPDTRDEIGEKFSCATLVVAALHYSGFSLDAAHRRGVLDIITPRQVVESRAPQTESLQQTSINPRHPSHLLREPCRVAWPR